MVENINIPSNTIETEKKSNEIAIKKNGKISKAQKKNEIIQALKKKRLESMTDEEIIEENLRTILESKSREERKANGRLIAVLVAFLVIFLAVYHAWIRKTTVLAGILVPAVIMVGYGGWVIILAKRDKRKRIIFERHIEEVTLKNKAELEKKAKANQTKSEEIKPKTKLHYENEISVKSSPTSTKQTITVHLENATCNNPKRKRCDKNITYDSDSKAKDIGTRKSSIRQKLFRQNATPNLLTNVEINHPNNLHQQRKQQNEVPIHEKRKKFQRMDTIPMPQVVRMSSAP